MKFSLALLLTIIAVLRVYSQTDSAEVVFAIKKTPVVVTKQFPVYYYMEASCEAEGDTTRSVRVTVKNDTLVFSVLNSEVTYFAMDSTHVNLTFNETGRLRIDKTEEDLSFSEIYKNGDESGPIAFVSLNNKIKTPDAFNLLCTFELRRNCRQQHNVHIINRTTVEINGKSIKCLKIGAEGSKTQRGKIYKGEESSFAYFKTRLTYLLEEETGVPLMIKEESADRGYPYCHTWFVTDIAQ